MAEKYTLFWHGPFSQWHPCEFTVDAVVYNSAEQYMMARKAKLFYDEESLAKIMAATSPKVQKALGRKVKNFDAEKWNFWCRGSVFDGNYAKFTQNPALLEKLLETRGTVLVEASPFDRIWGIGLGPNHPDAHDRSKWRGKNWLGQVLTDVRERIMAEKKIEEYEIKPEDK